MVSVKDDVEDLRQQGKTVAQIAYALGVKVSTVCRHLGIETIGVDAKPLRLWLQFDYLHERYGKHE